MDILTSIFHSPAGNLILGSYGGSVCLCDWAVGKRREQIDRRIQERLDATFATDERDALHSVKTQLDEYFHGERHELDIPIIFTGTQFQCEVWGELTKIPYGSTTSYAEIARRIGRSNAVRAVATAIANNPISIFVPCHRVIGSDNTLTGYRGGITAKRLLLRIEARNAQRTPW